MAAYSPEELLDESLTSEVCPGDCAHYGSLGPGVCPPPAFTRPTTPWAAAGLGFAPQKIFLWSHRW